MHWRLVYKNNGKVVYLKETNGVTHTRHNVYNCDNQEDCFNKIDELQLFYKGFSGNTIAVIFSGGTRTIIEEY